MSDIQTDATEPVATGAGQKTWWKACIGFAAALSAYNLWVTVPVWHALSGEDRATVVTYRSWLMSPTRIVFDIWSLNGEASMADIDRMLFKAASALKDRSYDGVILAYHGKARFLLDGERFRTIGEEWPDQNPIYVVRTIQQSITHVDGSEAFPQWTGGWLGVLGKELEQHRELHERWYMLSYAGLDPDGPRPGDGAAY